MEHNKSNKSFKQLHRKLNYDLKIHLTSEKTPVCYTNKTWLYPPIGSELIYCTMWARCHRGIHKGEKEVGEHIKYPVRCVSH